MTLRFCKRPITHVIIARQYIPKGMMHRDMATVCVFWRYNEHNDIRIVLENNLQLLYDRRTMYVQVFQNVFFNIFIANGKNTF